MDYFEIQGGKQLNGEVSISGAKNSVLLILCAALLGKSKTILKNVPHLNDVITMIEILNSLGAKTEFIKKNMISVDPSGLNKSEAPYDMVRKMRASICVLGPLLAIFGKAKISLPGGCVIGPRPVDIHIKGLTSLGATCSIKHGYMNIKGSNLHGEVFLGGRFGSSVTGTANILMASVLSNGTTYIESAAMEPEIQDLAVFLNKMGAKISGIGSHLLQIKGVKSLNGVKHTIIPDRIETGTFIIASAITKSEILLKNTSIHNIRAITDKLTGIGIKIKATKEGIIVLKSKILQATDIITLPFPGFPTDMQAQVMALLSISEGISVVTEKVYPERFMHISELNRMGASISLEGSTAIIKGVKALSGAPVMASDLRASAALVLAALVAEGTSTIGRVYHIDRGYENIEKKLSSLGAKITRKNG